MSSRRMIIAAALALLVAGLGFLFTRGQGSPATPPPGPPLPQLHNPGALVPGPNTAATPEGVAVMQRSVDQPAWAIRYGEEFWRAPSPAEPKPGPEQLPTGISVTDVAGRGRHRLQKNAEGFYSVDGNAFSVTVNHGMHFSPPTKPGAEKIAPLVVRTARIDLGKNRLFERQEREYLMNVNTAQAELSRGFVEHIEIFDAEAALVTIIKDPPPAGEDMEVTWSVSGMSYAGEAASRQQFRDAAGTVAVQVGPACAVDSGARKIPRPLMYKDNELSIKLPSSFLMTSRFPLAVELIVSAVPQATPIR